MHLTLWKATHAWLMLMLFWRSQHVFDGCCYDEGVTRPYIKARIVSFLVEVPRKVFKTFWAARRCAEWPLNSQSFCTAERPAEANRRAPQYVIGVKLSLVESLTPFHNAFSSSTIGVKNVFSYLGSLLISGTMPATIQFSHLNRSSLGNINHSSLFV